MDIEDRTMTEIKKKSVLRGEGSEGEECREREAKGIEKEMKEDRSAW